jgi:DNA-binding NarL/FixJ family response regulator
MIPPMINIAIADDHKIFRKGVILSLKNYSNIRFILEAENGEELIKGIEKEQPDIVLMDLKMPVKDGIETTKYLNKHFPAVQIWIELLF